MTPHDADMPNWIKGHVDGPGEVPEWISDRHSHSYPECDQPLFSVISPAFQHGHFLETTLTSVARQDLNCFEHIIVDGGSNDGTVTQLQTWDNLRWISEPDEGYVDALHKGLGLARGHWIMQCCVSDGLLVSDWLTRCLNEFRRRPELALVWGLPRYMSEEGRLGGIVYRDLFPEGQAPDHQETFRHWLSGRLVLPEGNLCVRKDVLEECLPSMAECNQDELDPWLEFSTRFFKAGYMAAGLPVVANFGRAHADSNTTSEFDRGVWRMRRRRFDRQVARARHVHVVRGRPKDFQSWEGSSFSSEAFSRRERRAVLFWAASRRAVDALGPLVERLPPSTRERLRSIREALLRPAGTQAKSSVRGLQ